MYRRKTYIPPTSPNSKELVQPEVYYSSINKTVGSNSKTPIIAPYSETEFLSTENLVNNSYSNVKKSNSTDNMYQEIPEPPLPRLVRSNQNAILVENAMYSSADQLNINNTAVSNPGLSSTDFGGSAFNIYAEPNKVLPPPIPDYKPSPSMYSIDLNPSHFRSQEVLSHEDSSSLHPFSSVYADPLPILRSDVLEVTEQNINEIKELGVGQFGTVILASTIGLSLRDLGLGNMDTSVSILVAVKKLHYDADAYEREAFEKEIKFMSRLKHENVVHILGVCLNTNAFIMMEYMENGDLNQYIQKFEFSPDCETSETDKFINVAVLIYMSLQIASGMRYLASMNFVHRDLATRNCLVGQKFVVKIADFGMSRQLYDNSYYRIRGKAMLPIRWMAKECFYGRFSEKTDVWAFGVVMWEIFTLCKQQPYEHLSDQEVIDDAVRGENRSLLQQPHPCPDEVYQVMVRCWSPHSEERATFEEIHGLLAQIHAYSDMA